MLFRPVAEGGHFSEPFFGSGVLSLGRCSRLGAGRQHRTTAPS